MEELNMRPESRWLLAIVVGGFSFLNAVAQCPPRPDPGTVVNDPFSISSQSGLLGAQFIMARSVDKAGYTHYCYKYAPVSSTVVEAPTLRVNPGDELALSIVNSIKDDDPMKMKMMMQAESGKVCGDGGAVTVDSTNVHFHGLNVPPKCHQDDVINTLIQPGPNPFQYDLKIP